ncbi:hypothetical protein B0H13DRAFT_2269250 [Mycena leptocephala]|nr:hypothetical protein B0H13DRAFT_2269250 [Mycena leptocephala]
MALAFVGWGRHPSLNLNLSLSLYRHADVTLSYMISVGDSFEAKSFCSSETAISFLDYLLVEAGKIKPRYDQGVNIAYWRGHPVMKLPATSVACRPDLPSVRRHWLLLRSWASGSINTWKFPNSRSQTSNNVRVNNNYGRNGRWNFFYGIYFNLFLTSTYLLVNRFNTGKSLDIYRSMMFVSGRSVLTVTTGFLLFDEGPAAFFADNRQPTALALVVSFISMLVNDVIWQVGMSCKKKSYLRGIVTTILTVIELARTDSVALTLSLTPSFVLTLVYVVGKKPDYLQRLESTWGLETPFKQLQAIQPRLRGGHKRSQATVGHTRSPEPWQDTSVTSMVLESGESGEHWVRHVFGADEPESEAEEWAFDC